MPTENADIAQPSSPPGERSTSFGPTLRVADLGASPLTGSKICPYCNDPECENPMFCAAYEPDAALRTVAMHDMEALDLPVQDMWGNALFSQHRLLLLQIAGVTASLVLHPNERILLGRMNERASEEHVLDLTAYEGHLKGVSRIHAAIAHLKARGARILGDGMPKTGAHGKPVVFLHPKDFNGALVELEQA